MTTAFPSMTLTRGSTTFYLNAANGNYLLRGVEGLDNPPVSLLMDDPATWDGSLYRSARYTAREVFLPVHLHAADTDEMRTKIKDLATLTDPKQGAVTLTVSQWDGSVRKIDGYLSAPMSSATAAGEGFFWRRLGLRLKCPDPYWYNAAASLSYSPSTSTVAFLSSTFLPMALSNSQVAGEITVTNNGDAEAYPVWTIQGPTSSIVVTVNGLTWAVPAALGSDETLIVDTRRGQQSAKVNSQLAWGRLADGSTLAAFPAGTSTLYLDVTGATTATVVSASWTERWLTAW